MGRPKLDQSVTSGAFLQLSRPASESHKFSQAHVPSITCGGRDFMTQLYRISPLYRRGNWGTEMSGTQEVWCWSVSLASSSSNQLSGTERGRSCRRWSELHFYLRITSDNRRSSPVLGVSPACFPFSFQIQCYAPTSPLPKYTYYILSICHKRSTKWGRMTPKLTAEIIYYCWVSGDSNLWNRFIWLRIQCFLNSLLGTK